MDMLAIFRPEVLIPWLLAMVFGVFVGGTPGLTATMAVALIVPISYYLSPVAGLAMILGVSFTAIFAGDIPATYLRIPGTPASGAAILDGFELNKKGQGSLALTLDLICSAVGGLIGVLILMLIAPPLAEFALRFTHFEYFWLGLFGLSTSAILSKGNTFRGTISAVLGMLVSTVGIDITTGYPRFTYGVTDLMGGISFIPAMIGLFGLSEVIKHLKDEKGLKLPGLEETISFSALEALKIIWKRKWILLKASLVGTAVGALPGAGADMGAWIAYGIEKKTSRKSAEFGSGCLDGVIAPTSANNAALGGTWIPALVFGVPGDTITAIVLGAMLMYGLKPGPLIFQQSVDIVHSIFAIALVSQVFLLFIGYLGIRAYSRLLSLPRNIILVMVVLFSIVGSYAINNSYFDVYVMLLAGLTGFIFETLQVPLPPLILGIILGPMIEDNLRVGLIKTGGSLLPFLFRPISLVLIALIIFMLFGSSIGKIFKKYLR